MSSSVSGQSSDEGGENSGVYPIAFLADGRYIVSGGRDKKIRRSRVEDGVEDETSIDVGSEVYSLAVSRDGQWVVSGTDRGEVAVWNAVSHEKKIQFEGHTGDMLAVDVSPDSMRIATGSVDCTACVWSLLTGERLLGPWQYDDYVGAAKFSPDGRFVATASWNCETVRIHDGQGDLFIHVPVRVTSSCNQSLAWTSDGRQLYILSHDGNIHCLDVSTRAMRSQWRIHSDSNAWCIALACDGKIIAASTCVSVSLWDTTTHNRIGTLIRHTAQIKSIAISTNCDLAMSGGQSTTFCNLSDFLLSHFGILARRPMQRMEEQKVTFEETIKSLRSQVASANSEVARLQEANQQLHVQLSDSKQSLDKVVESFRAQETKSNTQVSRLEQQLHDYRSRADSLDNAIESLHAQETESKNRIVFLEKQLHGSTQLLRAHEQKYNCEALYARGHIIDAAILLVEMTKTANEEVRANRTIMDWITKFKNQCILTLETTGDNASRAKDYDTTHAAYSTALLLNPPVPNTLLTKWASAVLVRASVNDAVTVAARFNFPSFVVHRAICDVLEKNDRISEAVECFQQLLDTDNHDATYDTEWVANFKTRCLKALKQQGDIAMDATSYNDAVVRYTAALALCGLSTDLLIKRSKARAAIGSWEDSLEDANAAIRLDPSSPGAYERKHATLLGAHRYDEAIDAFNDMLLKLEESSDHATRQLRNNYVSPSQTIAAIRTSIERTQRSAPLVLINTETGRLCDQQARMDAAEADPKFNELVASIMTKRDNSRITPTVKEYFRYATFSHTWEGDEPLYHDVRGQSVLVVKHAKSPTAFKLMMFCMTAREARLRWAWSDTCCIDKKDGSILQESLTSMFKWYHESALTIIHLKGVLSNSDRVTLENCSWNMRAWTLQEFFASRVIHFYTEDWKRYRPHESTGNDKDSVEIMAEMAAANGIDSHALLSLRPGSENVRQKLCLAAARIATKQEDIAYSLFGIFDVSIQVKYGEGQQYALGRLLQEVLTQSGDLTILAWTGKASEYNSCLPAEIGVYREPASPHIPPLIEDDKMDTLVAELRLSQFVTSAIALYDQIAFLPSPRPFSRRLSVSCITFPLKGQLAPPNNSRSAYYGMTSALGKVKIETTESLAGLKNLVLVHPWLKCLLDPALPSEDLIMGDDDEQLTPIDEDDKNEDSDAFPPFTPYTASTADDKLGRALRLFARLRQPFGALLLVPLSHNEYRRVACDQPIVVQLQKNVPPRYLTEKIRTLDIL